jgi:hypothetical protein
LITRKSDQSNVATNFLIQARFTLSYLPASSFVKRLHKIHFITVCSGKNKNRYSTPIFLLRRFWFLIRIPVVKAA